MDLCNFINKAISHTPEVEIHTRTKLCHFGRYLIKAKLFCLKCFDPVTRLECSYGKIFIPVTEISVAKTSYEHFDIFTKKRVARRDLGNRASPVDRAHMKRVKLLIVVQCVAVLYSVKIPDMKNWLLNKCIGVYQYSIGYRFQTTLFRLVAEAMICRT